MTADPVDARPRFTLGVLQTLATITLVVFMLWAARVVIIPIALAVFIVFVLSPVVGLIERRAKLPRTPAVLVTLLLTAGVVGGVGYIVAGQASALIRELPGKRDKIQQKVDDIRGSGGPVSEVLTMIEEIATGDKKLKKDLQKDGKPAANDAAPVVVARIEEPSGVGALAETALPIVEPLANAALVGILVVFFLVNREDMRNRVIGLFGRGKVTGTTRVLSDAAERVSTFLLFQLIVNAGFGLCLAVGLYFIGVEYAPLWGLLSAILRFIPFLGTWLSALFPFVVSFATSDGWGEPLMVIGYFAVLDLITANVIEPLLFGHQTGVSPVALLVAAAFWVWLWGPIGLLLSTPITVCLAVIGQHVPRLRPLALLLGDDPALDPHVAYYQRLLAKDKSEAATLTTPPADQVTANNAVLGTFDKVAVPGLLLARKDRDSGGITAEEETAMFDMTADIVADLAKLKEPATDESRAAYVARQAEIGRLPVVVGAPSHHRAEEVVLAMLGAGLPAHGRRLVTLTARQLPVEVEQAVTANAAHAVVVGVTPPGGVPQALYLVKRLREKFPNLPIVVAYFGRTRRFDELLVRFRKAGATYVTTSLVQTADTVKAAAAPPAGTPAGGPAAQDKTKKVTA